MKKIISVFIFNVLLIGMVQAQYVTDLPQLTRTYAFTNITIVQSPGRKIENATLLIKDGLIQGVGKNITIPAEAIILKADSMYAYAGFIDGLCKAGIGMRHDGPQEKMHAPGVLPASMAGIMPYTDLRSMLNPEDKAIEQLRNLGFTAAQVVPDGNFLPGQSALILLSGRSADDIIIQNKNALYSNLTGTRGIYPSTAMGILATWRELYRQSLLAKSYQQLYASNPAGLVHPDADRTLEAFYPVIDQQKPVLFKAEKVTDIQRVMALKSDLGFSLIMADVKEGWPLTAKVKASGAKVFLSLDLPQEIKINTSKLNEGTFEANEREHLNVRMAESISNCKAQASVFKKAGIAFGFCSYSANVKDITANLRKIVAAGLSEDDALAALTTTPANFFGLSDRMGTLDVGKMANIVISNKPYFQQNARVQYVVVDGSVYPVEGGAADALKIEGGWTVSVQTSRGIQQDRLNIRKSENGYVGTFFSEVLQAPVDLKDIKLIGNKLSFTYKMGNDAAAPELIVEVVVTGSTFKGVLNGARFKNLSVEGIRDTKN